MNAPALQPSAQSETLASWAAKWLAARPLADNSRRAYQREIDRLLTWCSNADIREPSALNGARVRSFLNDVASSEASALSRFGGLIPLSPGSITQSRRIVGLFVQDSVRAGILLPDVLGSTKIRGEAEPDRRVTGRRVVYSEKVVQRLLCLRTASPVHQLAVGLAFWCAISPKQMTGLRWRHLRKVGPSVFLRLPDHTKTSTTRQIELPPKLAKCLNDIRTQRPVRAPDVIFRADALGEKALSARTIARWLHNAAHDARAPNLASARALQAAFVAITRARRWKESEILFRRRRSRICYPPLPTNDRAATKDLLALERNLYRGHE